MLSRAAWILTVVVGVKHGERRLITREYALELGQVDGEVVADAFEGPVELPYLRERQLNEHARRLQLVSRSNRREV